MEYNMNGTKTKYYCGIDVSKDTIAICYRNKYLTIANNHDDIFGFFAGCERADRTLVVLENTGGYEQECVRVLKDLGFKVHRTNNNRFKNWIKFKGLIAKTDKIDAKMLARYGQENHDLTFYVDEKNEKETQCLQLFNYLNALKRTRATEKNRLQSPGFRAVTDKISKIIADLSTMIDQIERELFEYLSENSELNNKVNLLQSYCGIGAKTATSLIFLLPELGKISSRKICALSGLAPYNRDSGTIRGYRTTKGNGRIKIKQTLFTGALAAIRFNPLIREFFNNLISRGKKRIVANAIIRDGGWRRRRLDQH